MSGQIVPVVYTPLWRDGPAQAQAAKGSGSCSTTAAAASTTTRASCGCRTNNADLGAWCALHREQVRGNEDVGTEQARGDAEATSKDGCALAKALEGVSITDDSSQRAQTTQMQTQMQTQTQPTGPVLTGSEEDRDRQFRMWLWDEFARSPEFAYPGQ